MRDVTAAERIRDVEPEVRDPTVEEVYAALGIAGLEPVERGSYVDERADALPAPFLRALGR